MQWQPARQQAHCTHPHVQLTTLPDIVVVWHVDGAVRIVCVAGLCWGVLVYMQACVNVLHGVVLCLNERGDLPCICVADCCLVALKFS